MNIHNPPHRHLTDRLEYWRPQIERALSGSDLLTFDDIKNDILEVRKLLFDNGKAFAVVDVQDYTRGRVCHVLVAAGSLAGLRELQELTKPFFKEIGARRLSMVGRPGFMRRLPALGWKSPRIYMELELDDG